MAVPDHPIHPSTQKTGHRPPCHSENRGRLAHEAEYTVEDRNYMGGRWVKSTRTIVNDWIEGGRCQQPGPGYKPNAGCLECKDLKPWTT